MAAIKPQKVLTKQQVLFEIDKRVASTLSVVRGENRKLRDVINALAKANGANRALIEAMPADPITELPDTLLYETHLAEFNRIIRKDVAAHVKNLSESVEGGSQRAQERDELIDRKVNSLNEEFSAHDHDKTYFSIEAHEAFIAGDYSAFAEAVESSFKEVHASIIGLAESAETELDAHAAAQKSAEEFFDKTITAHVKQLNSELAESSRLRAAADDKLKKQITKATKDGRNELAAAKKAIHTRTKSIVKHVNALKRELRSDHSDLADSLNDIAKTFSEHNHDDQYAATDHEHSDLATKKALAIIRKQGVNNEQKIGAVDEIFRKLEDVVSKKANKSETILKSDIGEVIEAVKRDVMSNLVLPADGKDAHEWEFQFHDRQRGLLMYKRSDWLNWKTANILGPPGQSGGAGVTGFGGISGSGGAGNMAIYSGGTLADTSRVFSFNDTVTTDADGFWEYQYPEVNGTFAEVISYSAETTMLPDPNSLMTAHERRVDVSVEAAGNETIKGYAFANIRQPSLIGTPQYTTQPIKSGHPININVIILTTP